MSFVVTARKWRPVNFAEVVGQDHVIQTLTNALSSGRVAHALLFCGPRGVGKTTVARILARALNCEVGPTPEPCGECSACREARSGGGLDIIEMDAASHRRVEDVRQLRESVRLAPTRGRSKVYIIDEVHMLTSEAFNTLLKTLEEPPSGVVFILATTDSQKVPSTIISRCQRFDFRLIPESLMVEQLARISVQEGIEAEPEALAVVAQEAQGALRDAQCLFDQVVAFSGGRLTSGVVHEVLGLADDAWYQALIGAIAGRDVARVLRLAHDAIAAGKDIPELIVGLVRRLRDVLVARALDAEDGGASIDGAWVEVAAPLSDGDLLRMLRIVGELEFALARSSDPRLALEVALVRLARLDRTVDLEALLAALEGSPVPETAASAPKSAPPAPVVTADTSVSPPKRRRPATPGDAGAAEPSSHRPPVEPGSVPQWWEKFLEALRGKDRRLWSALEDRLVFLGESDEAVRLGVPERGASTHKRAVEEKRKWLEDLLFEHHGERLRLELVPLAKAPKEPGASPSNSDPFMVRFDGAVPAIEKVLEALGAEVAEPPLGSLR